MGRLAGLFIVGIVLAVAAAFLVRKAQAQDFGTVNIPVDCGKSMCVLSKPVFMAVVESHNAAIDEIRKLKSELAGRGRTCPDDKGA